MHKADGAAVPVLLIAATVVVVLIAVGGSQLLPKQSAGQIPSGPGNAPVFDHNGQTGGVPDGGGVPSGTGSTSATATLRDNTTGATATMLAKTCTVGAGWRQATATITPGHSYTLTLVSHDENNPRDATGTTYDDIATS